MIVAGGTFFGAVLSLQGLRLAWATDGPTTHEPARERPTDAGVVTMQTPASDQVLILAGTFYQGSTVAEIARARAECEREDLRHYCSRSGEPTAVDDVPQLFEDEFAPHEVYLSSFWIDRYEVSVAQYKQCSRAGQCAAVPFEAGGQRFALPSFPVTLVTWDDARTYCEWAGGRLPTEAEWERAARGLTRRQYPWGDVYNPFLSNHGQFSIDPLDRIDGFAELAPVGSFVDGRTPDGIADLVGNVSEWVADYWSPAYSEASQVNPTGPGFGDYRVARGGDYASGRPFLRAAVRARSSPGTRSTTRGFRCARTAR